MVVVLTKEGVTIPIKLPLEQGEVLYKQIQKVGPATSSLMPYASPYHYPDRSQLPGPS